MAKQGLERFGQPRFVLRNELRVLAGRLEHGFEPRLERGLTSKRRLTDKALATWGRGGACLRAAELEDMRFLGFYAAVLVAFSGTDAHGEVTLSVASPAARFSPATWSGDSGRGGGTSRTTWNNGAWCEFRWTSPAPGAATLNIANRTPGSAVSYFVDGALFDNVPVPAQGGVPIQGLSQGGRHTLRVYTRNSAQSARWSGENAFTVTGLTLADGATGEGALPVRPWVLVIGDSITEGIQADNGADSSLSDYAFLVGQGLDRVGYDCAVSACGYSGWIRPGDARGDVPAYYAVTGGVYDADRSRWNRIDARTSLLDASGHISGYGGTGQEPAAIVINYMVNEALSGAPAQAAQASVTGALTALRRAAPKALLLVLVPPGLANTRVYSGKGAYIDALRAGVAAYRTGHPSDRNVALVDWGVEVANALASPAYGGGVHPHAAGQAYIAAHLLPELLERLESPGARGFSSKSLPPR